MSQGHLAPTYEPLLNQPYSGVTLELVRMWHHIDGVAKPVHKYRARRGPKVLAEHITLATVREEVEAFLYRSNRQPAQPKGKAAPSKWLSWLN